MPTLDTDKIAKIYFHMGDISAEMENIQIKIRELIAVNFEDNYREPDLIDTNSEIIDNLLNTLDVLKKDILDCGTEITELYSNYLTT